MPVLSALLPGVRQVRGPLVAGYLWMLAIYLAFGNVLPSKHTSDLVARLDRLADVVGPTGTALAASLTAYLIGSLLDGLLGAAVELIRRGLIPREERSSFSIRFSPYWMPLRSLLPDEWKSVHSFMFHDAEAADQLLEAATGEVGAGLTEAIEAEGRDNRILVKPERRSAVLILPDETGEPSNHPYPTAPGFALRESFPLIRASLRELAPAESGNIERLYSEADFRLAVGPPVLGLLAVAAYYQQAVMVAALFVVALGFFWHAVRLRALASDLILEALRRRAGTEDLEMITPIFQRWCHDAERLAEAVRAGNWNSWPPPSLKDDFPELKPSVTATSGDG
jgi:hypothetical protein